MASDVAHQRQARRALWPAAGRDRLLAVVRTLAVVALVVIVLTRVDLAKVGAALAGCDWRLVAAGGLAHLCSSALKALTWQALVDGLPAARGRSRPTDLFPAFFVGALVNSALVGRAGEVPKVLIARRRLEDRGARVELVPLAGSVASEHLVACVGWAIVVCAIAVAGGVPVEATLAAALIGGVCALIMIATSLTSGAPGRSGRIARTWAGLTACNRALRSPRRIGLVLGYAVLQWIAQVASILLVLHGTGLGRVGLAGAAAVMVALTVAHAVPISPGNVGIFQAAAMLPLSAVWAVPSSAAVAFGVVLQVSETAVALAAGSLVSLRLGAGRRGEVESTGRDLPALAGPVPTSR